MKNFRKTPWQPCCYYCNHYNIDYDMDYCDHPDNKDLTSLECEVEPTDVCDNFVSEIHGN